MKEKITLIPHVGDPLTLDGIILVTSVDWGMRRFVTTLAEGTDIIGSVPGSTQRPSIESTVRLLIDPTEPTFQAVNSAFELAVANLAEYKGHIRRERRLADGTLIESVVSEVLNAEHTDPNDFLLERELTLARQPGWTTEDWVQAASYTGADRVADVDLSALRGDTLAIARVRWEDQTGEGARYAQVGQEWTQYDPLAPAPLILLAADADYTDGSLDAAVVGPSISPLLAFMDTLFEGWQTVARFDDLPHRGLWVPSTVQRLLIDPSSAVVTIRILVREGKDQWHEVGRRVIPTAHITAGWRRLTFDPISRFGPAETMDLAIQVMADGIYTAPTELLFDHAEMVPAQRFTTLRGLPVPGINTAIVAVDDFRSHGTGDLAGKLTPVGGHTWVERGDVAPKWTTEESSESAGRLVVTGSEDADYQTGGYALVDEPVGGFTIEADMYVVLGTNGPVNASQSVVALVGRNDGTGAALVAGAQLVQGFQGTYVRIFSVWKVAGGVFTLLASTPLKSTKSPWAASANSANGKLALDRAADGSWVLRAGALGDDASVEILSGQDADLSTANLGNVFPGLYYAGTRRNSFGEVNNFQASGAPDIQDPVHVVRPNGIGIHNHRLAYSAELDDTAKQSVVPQGNGFLVPPGDSRLAVVTRVEDSKNEEDIPPSGNIHFIVEYKPTFTGLSDEVEP